MCNNFRVNKRKSIITQVRTILILHRRLIILLFCCCFFLSVGVHGHLHPKGHEKILHLMITNILLSSSDDNSVPIANFTKIPASVKE